MKTKFKNFYFGNRLYKAYCKPAGFGWEVGFLHDNKPVFVGNFIHKTEAGYWWKKMCQEATTFCNKYEYFTNASATWNNKFFGNYFYKLYYTWLDANFNKYRGTYTRAIAKDLKTYKRLQKNSYSRVA